MKKQSAKKGFYNLEYELNKFGSCQRRLFPPMRSITCFSYHKPRNIAAYCKTKQIQYNQQRMQKMKRLPQANKWRGQLFTRYTNRFHGYCFSCNEFGHKSVECKLCSKRGTKYYTSAQTYLGKIRCYVCLELVHKAKDCKLPYTLNNSRQMMESNQIRQNCESKRSVDIMKNPNKVWKEKRKGEHVTSIT